MSEKQHQHQVFKKNKLSFDKEEGKQKESYVQISLETFYEYKFHKMLTNSELLLYLAIYSEIDKTTNKVQRSPNYWMEKVGISEDTIKRARPRLQKMGLIRATHHKPIIKRKNGQKFGKREYDEYSICSFEDALKTQVENGLRPREDLNLLPDTTQSLMAITEEKEEEVRNYKNQPTNKELEEFNKQRDTKTKPKAKKSSKAPNKASNLISTEATYYHPVLNGATSAPKLQQKEDGDFEYIYEEEEAPEYFYPEDIIEYFYKELNIPDHKRNTKRDKGALRKLWRETFGPISKHIRVETIDLIMFTISSAKALSYDKDRKLEDIFQLQYYTDEGMASLQDKMTIIVQDKDQKPDTTYMDITEEELEEAKTEYSFLDDLTKEEMIDTIRVYGYKKGFSDRLKELKDIYEEAGKEIRIDQSIRDEYYYNFMIN
jgi:hypothetical protein